MGMTIDKAIPKLQFVRNALNDDMEIAKAYDMAISTMRKYQKIEQILHDNWIKGVSSGATLAEIEEVIEDEDDKV